MDANMFRKSVMALGLCFAAQAGAGTIVTEWSYDLGAVWSSFAPATVGVSGDQKTLSWGTSTGSGQSSLVITDPASPSPVDTYIGGGAVPAVFIADAVTLTHNNNPITGTSLESAMLTATLGLTAVDPAGAAFALPPLAYDILFEETPNSGLPGNCAVPSSPTACNDIFVQVTGLLNQSFFYDTGDGAVEYFVNIFPTSGGVLSVLPTSACDAVLGATSPGCIGFSTPEGESTDLAFGFTISTEPLSVVPAPGVLALLGIGLAAAGFSSRRRKQRG